MSLQNILSKTEQYLRVPAVVRFEHPFIAHLADDFSIPGYEVERQDRILVVKKKGSKSDKILTAHIDRHGIVVNQDGKFEYASSAAKKQYGQEITDSKEFFEILGQKFVDEIVYGYDQKGIPIAEGRVKSFSYDDVRKELLFTIEGIEKLPLGTAVSYKSPLMINQRISSQIDNAVSVAVAYQLIQDGFDGTLIFATEEEVGRSWQHIVNYLEAQKIASDKIITLDTTPYDDARAILDGLIVLRNKDENGKFNPDLVQRLKSACSAYGIRFEMKDEVIEAQNAQLAEGAKPKKLGKTELGRIVQHTNGRFNGATVQLPTTSYHSNHETTSELAIRNYYNLLLSYLSRSI